MDLRALTRCSFLLFTSAVIALAATSTQNHTLPQATYVGGDNNTWLVTVPAEWNYTTILEATNRSFAVNNYSTTFLDSADSPDGNATWSPPNVYVNGTFSLYATNSFNYALQQDYNTSTTAYTDEAWALPVVCEWPISGLYSRLQRILYYTLLVFALVWRHHEWLIAGALAYATTYSGAAAVQAWVQFGVDNKYHDTAGDNDNEAIMGILAAALLMAVPLINWSRTLRRLQVRPILIYWAIIVFVGYLLVIIGEKQTEYSHGWSKHAGGIMTCNTKAPIPKFHNLGFLDHDFINKYNCDDPCYNPSTMHPFHAASNVISRVVCDQWQWAVAESTTQYACFTQCPRDIAENCWLEHSGWTEKDYRINNVGYYAILPVACFELFFILCFGRMSPEDIRDLMFQTFVGKKLLEKYRSLPASKRKHVKVTWRIGLAQAGGMIFYIFALATYFVCVPFFFFNIAWQETLLRFFPDAESPWEIGQWLPWVSVLLTIGAAVVGKYHHTWRIWIRHYIFRQRHSNPVVHPVQAGVEKGYDAAGWIQRHSWRTKERLRLEWESLKDFIKHPFFLVLDTARERTTEHPTVKYSLAGSLPFPSRAERNSRAHYRGPWTKSSAWPRFPVELFVQADRRTLASWERYASRQHEDFGGGGGGDDDGQHIVYNIDLPPVPSHPDRRTVLASARDVVAVQTAIGPEDPAAPNSGLRLTEAITLGARKQSTVSYRLREDVAAVAAAAARGSVSSGKSSVSGSASVASPRPNADGDGDPIMPVSPGGSETALKKQGSWVIETAIPPSRMSSMRVLGSEAEARRPPPGVRSGQGQRKQVSEKTTPDRSSGIDAAEAAAVSQPAQPSSVPAPAPAEADAGDGRPPSNRGSGTDNVREEQRYALVDDREEQAARDPLLSRRDATSNSHGQEGGGG